MYFTICKENKGLKAGMLRNIAFDIYWYEFLGNTLVFQKELI